jgi:hypothetical protein
MPKVKEIRTSVRLPEPIHKVVVQLSQDERRSFNAQILRMIEDYLQRHNVVVTESDKAE